MSKLIFLNLPVSDLDRSIRFYEAIGASRDPQFSTDRGARMVFSDTISVMLLTHDFFATFSDRPIADAHAGAQVLICLSEDSRAAVDAIVEKAVAAGGRGDINAPDDHGFMYGRSFEDPDGHIFAPMWMDVAAATAAR